MAEIPLKNQEPQQSEAPEPTVEKASSRLLAAAGSVPPALSSQTRQDPDDLSAEYRQRADDDEAREVIDRLNALQGRAPSQTAPSAEQENVRYRKPTVFDYQAPGTPIGEPYSPDGVVLWQKFKLSDGTEEERRIGSAPEGWRPGDPIGGPAGAGTAVEPSELVNFENVAVDVAVALRALTPWGAGAILAPKIARYAPKVASWLIKKASSKAATKITAKEVLERLTQEVGWGLVASGSIDAGAGLVRQFTDSQIADLVSSVGSPMLGQTLARSGVTGARKAIATYFKRRGLVPENLSYDKAAKALKDAAEKGELEQEAIDRALKLAAERKANPTWAEFEGRRMKLVGDPNAPVVRKINKAQAMTEGGEKQLFEDIQTRDNLLPGMEALPDFAYNINFSNIDDVDQVKQVLLTMAEGYGEGMVTAARGVRSHEATIKAADSLGMTVQDLLKRKAGQNFNAEEALAARNLVVSSANQLRRLAKEVMVSNSDEAVFAFQHQMAIHYAIQAEVSGMTAEAGRALNAFKIPATGGVEARVTQIQDLIKAATIGGERDPRIMAEMVANLDSPEAMSQFAREARKVTTFDKLTEVWINALLSGPQTHAVNFLSNSLVALWQIPERLLAVSFGALRGDAEITMGEAIAQAFGMMKGIREGLRAFGKSIRTGESSDVFGKVDLPRRRAISGENFNLSGTPGRAMDLLGEGIRLPGRFLTAEDDFFKAVGYRMELNARAYRQVRSEGLKGKAAAARIRELVDKPSADLHMAAVDAARYQTFTKDYNGASRQVQKMINKVPALRLVMPFIRTPANIMKFTFERTPLGLVMKDVKADIAAGGARRQLALARMSLGSMVMATTVSMAAEGLITGGGPSDPKTRALMRAKGWQPYSIKIGNTYYSYGRMEPLGGLLGMAADLSEIMGQVGEEEGQKLAIAAIAALSRNVTSKTYLRGLSEIVNTLDDPGRYGERYIQRFAGTVVPTGVAQMARYMNPRLMEVYSIMDQIKSRIPGWSNSLNPRRNVFGEVIALSGGWGPDIISPIYTSREEPDPVIDELLRQDIKLSHTPRQINQIELKPKEYDDYARLAGNELKLNRPSLWGPGPKGMKEALAAVFAGEGVMGQLYKKMPGGGKGSGKEKVALDVVYMFRQEAQEKVKELHPGLAAEIERQQQERFEARRPLQ